MSRLHAYLAKSVQGYYYLVDNDSKFGTLSLVKTPLQLKVNSQTVLQIGRTLFDIDCRANYRSILSQCLCFNQKRKRDCDNELMLTVNGLQSFPAQFASA